jgi:glucokinase
MSDKDTYCIGIDFGGTNTKFCLLDSRKRPTGMFQLATAGTPEDIVSQMINGARRVMSDNDVLAERVAGVGIGSPGPLDLKNGVILATPNIAGMENFPIRNRVSGGLGIQCVLENDANAAAYGEYICGAGKSANDMVLLTLGTGIGSGIIIDGKVLHGSHDIGAEVGHMLVEPDGEQCGCGQRGCLERYCSATYIAQHARKLIETEGRGGLLAAVLKQSGQVTTKDIVEAADAGDELAREVWQRGVYFLAVACVNLCRIFDPDEIVLAGGMAKAGAKLLDPVLKQFRKLHWSITKIMTRIDIAALGNDAGVIGAAGVAWSAFAPDTEQGQ